jgi:hypothetical protein
MIISYSYDYGRVLFFALLKRFYFHVTSILVNGSSLSYYLSEWETNKAKGRKGTEGKKKGYTK